MSYKTLILLPKNSPDISQTILEGSMKDPKKRIKEALATKLISEATRSKNPWIGAALLAGALSVMQPTQTMGQQNIGQNQKIPDKQAPLNVKPLTQKELDAMPSTNAKPIGNPKPAFKDAKILEKESEKPKQFDQPSKKEKQAFTAKPKPIKPTKILPEME